MKRNWRRIMTAFGFVGCMAMVAPACVVRARVRPAVVVVDEAPPEPTYETVRPRSGYVWVRGHWQMRNSRWKWQRGHWVRARSGHSWQAGHWERRGGRHHWVAGRWITGAAPAGPAVRDHRAQPAPAPGPVVRDHRAQPAPAAYPTAAPPPPQYARPAVRAGYIWVRGRHDWKGGRWVWTAGHWQRAKANHTWTPGQWVRRGDRYVWTAGKWTKAAGPAVRDHRKKAPPPPPARKNERVPATRGGN